MKLYTVGSVPEAVFEDGVICIASRLVAMDKLVPWGHIAICDGNTYSFHTRSSHRDPQSQDETVP